MRSIDKNAHQIVCPLFELILFVDFRFGHFKSQPPPDLDIPMQNLFLSSRTSDLVISNYPCPKDLDLLMENLEVLAEITLQTTRLISRSVSSTLGN